MIEDRMNGCSCSSAVRLSIRSLEQPHKQELSWGVPDMKWKWTVQQKALIALGHVVADERADFPPPIATVAHEGSSLNRRLLK